MAAAVLCGCLLQVIFQHYARDLESVQAQYEAQKHNPPVPHNVPPTAGNIMWSRHLLCRIEEPMNRFAQNKSLMATKESKKVIKLYNRVSAWVAVCQHVTRAVIFPVSMRHVQSDWQLQLQLHTTQSLQL